MSGPFIIYGEQMWTFTYTLVGRCYLHYDSESPLPGSYAREMKMYIHRKACMGMFIVARFIISLNVNNASVYQKQNGQISDGLSIQWNPIQQLKKNKLLIHETWVNLTDIKLCEWRQIFKKDILIGHNSVPMKFQWRQNQLWWQKSERQLPLSGAGMMQNRMERREVSFLKNLIKI